MHKKKIITFNIMSELIEKSGGSFFKIDEEYKKLPNPTLRDIVGLRQLGRIQNDEIKKLLELYEKTTVKIVRIEYIPFGEYYVEYKFDNISKGIYIYMGKISALGREIEIFKWFIKKGFNVMEEYLE